MGYSTTWKNIYSNLEEEVLNLEYYVHSNFFLQYNII